MLAVARHTFSWSSIRLLKDRRCTALDAVTIWGVSVLTVKKGLAVSVVVGVCVTALRFCWETANDLYSSHEEGLGRREIEMHGTLFFGSRRRRSRTMWHRRSQIGHTVDLGEGRF